MVITWKVNQTFQKSERTKRFWEFMLAVVIGGVVGVYGGVTFQIELVVGGIFMAAVGIFGLFVTTLPTPGTTVVTRDE